MQENSVEWDGHRSSFCCRSKCPWEKGEVGRDQTASSPGAILQRLGFILCATACHPTLQNSHSLCMEAELLWWGRKEARRWTEALRDIQVMSLAGARWKPGTLRTENAVKVW